MKRAQNVEEDEFVARTIVNGVPDYSHFRNDGALPPPPDPVDRKDHEARQKGVNNAMLRFCIMRVFRPDLLEEQVRDFIEVFLDSSMANQPAVNYMAIGRAAESQAANLLIKDGSIDVQGEVARLQKVASKVSLPIHYLSLNEQSLAKVPQIITQAAMAGHWVLLDDLQNVSDQIPELERFLNQVFSWKGEKELRAKKELRRIEELQEDFNEDMRRELDEIEAAALLKASAEADDEEGSRRLVLPALKDFEVT